MDKRKGFTLIELVIVIVILGILAAFIVPRFASLSTEARTSTIKSMGGALRSASAIVHALAITKGQTGATGSVTMEDGTSVDVVYGYPDGTTDGIGESLQDISGFTPAYTQGVATYTKDGAPTPANCSVTYTRATASTAAVISTPITSGC